MISAESFIEAAASHGFRLYTGVPCSFLKPFINYCIDSEQVRYVGAANEGDAIGIAAGAELGGLRSVAMFQNSGLGNAVNPLTSLTYTLGIPVLLIPTLRGDPAGAPDEPQHDLMGRITGAMLELMGIPWEYFPTEEAEVAGALSRAVTCMDAERRPYALLMKKGSVESWPLRSRAEPRPVGRRDVESAESRFTRQDMLRAVQASAADSDVIVATTGYTGRELYACEDRPNQLYMVGSMGCASSVGLGIALACPERRVIVLDGDGAVLMRMGALATVGYERPPNLVHVVLDNGVHESTGGQSTVAHSLDLPGVAVACGYPDVRSVDSPEGLAAALEGKAGGLRFVHVKVKPGVPDGLPRPCITPEKVAARLRHWVRG